jgi:hypothetical protein
MIQTIESTEIETSSMSEKVFELLYNGKLTWTVNKEQLYTEDGTIAPTAFATRRSDNGDVLGIVGGRYAILQNQQLAQEFIQASEGFGLTEIAGTSVNGGRKVVIRAKIGSIQIGTDTVHRYITVSNTHDGTGQVRLGMYQKVLVCSNGLMREISSNELAKVKHTTNASEKMNWYIRNIPQVLEAERQMMENYKLLSEVKVNQKHIQALIDHVYQVDSSLPTDEISARKQNQVKEFDKALTTNGLNVHGNTLWGALQAMTYIQSRDMKSGRLSDDKVMTGSGQEKSNLTYELLMKMIGNPAYEMELEHA